VSTKSSAKSKAKSVLKPAITNSKLVKPDRQARLFIKKVSHDYPDLIFKQGKQEHWSPRSKTVTYNLDQPLQELHYGVLHELAHAILGHSNYSNDFELLKMEADAWDMASHIGHRYGVEVSANHIQNCLDTYRDWLHRRSTCPNCEMHVLQKDSSSYYCFNCQTSWKVSSSRFVRSYRLKTKLSAS
jgi:hypothetical protein